MALAIALFAAGLGVAPHLRFSAREGGEFAWFKSAYDEDTYARLMVEGRTRNDRALSNLMLGALHAACDRRLEATLVAADVVLPLIASLAAFWLAGCLVEGLAARALITLLLLFGQELLSFGCTALFRPDGLLSLARMRSAIDPIAPGWIPDFTTTYFSLWRTPEPQVSWTIAFLHLAALLCFLRAGASRRGLPALAGLALSNAALPWCYVFVALPLAVSEVAACGMLLVRRRGRSCGWRLAAAILPLAAVWGVRALAVAADPRPVASSVRHVFASSLPVLTPSVVYGLLLLAASWTLLAAAKPLRRSVEAAGGWVEPYHAIAFSCAAFATPLIVLNQQVLTGLMISTRDFERCGNYLLLVAGASVLASLRPRPIAIAGRAGPASWRRRAGALVPAVLALAAGVVVVRGQLRTFQAFLPANESSLAMARAVLSSSGAECSSRLLLDDPQLAPLLATRLIGKWQGVESGGPSFVLDYTDISRRPLPRRVSENPDERASAEFHEGKVFEHFARLGRSPRELRAMLEREASAIGKESGYFLHFLYPLSEVWYPLTEGRHVQPESVRSGLDAILTRYETALHEPPEYWKTPVLLLQRVPPWPAERAGSASPPETPGAERFEGDWRLEPLGGVASAGGAVYQAWCQTWSPASARPSLHPRAARR